MRNITRFISLPFFLLPVVFLVASVAVSRGPATLSTGFMMVQAEDDEEDGDDDAEDDEEDDEESDSSDKKKSSQSSNPKTVEVIKEVVEYRPVTKTIIVTEEAYATDTDGDLLVDAIDPDPKVPQSEYFTDTDDDGVPNAIDRHHDEDDFAYYEFETDDNGNGILDSYEEE